MLTIICGYQMFCDSFNALHRAAPLQARPAACQPPRIPGSDTTRVYTSP